MCAGTYGHDLLGIGAARSFEIRCSLEQGDVSQKPGWTRISFSPATSEEDFQLLLNAVCDISRNYKEYIDEYELVPGSDTWRRKDFDESIQNRPLTLLPPHMTNP